MQLARRVFGVFTLSFLATVLAVTGGEPEVLTIDFSEPPEVAKSPQWAAAYEVRGGVVENGVWKVQSTEPVGSGQLDISWNPAARIPALAVTIAMKDLPESDLSIQLYNAEGELVAVDLFGNLAESAREGRTDTFIVPVEKYPTATRLAIRRIKGPLELQGVVAFPVVEALKDLTLTQKQEFARWLGERLEDPSATAGFRSRDGNSLEPLTSSLLDAPDYPERAWRTSLAPALAFPTYCSGTCYRFFTNIYFSLFPGIRGADQVEFVSSNVSLEAMLNGKTNVALMSMPPSDAQREQFRAKFGYPMIEIPVALDAVELLVHASNRLPSISFKSLRGIFSDEAPLRFWDRESGLTGPVMPAGGNPSWGTSKFFSERVMDGAAFRNEMVQLDVAFPRGVEEFISKNTNAIGFSQHRARTHSVRVLPISESDAGPALAANAVSVNDNSYPLARPLYLVLAASDPASLPDSVRRFADFLLSREGQKVVAETGSFPLPANVILAARKNLALP